ncbi:ALQxL family class IV lanthipeptide [Streptomyces sp. E11-3]|uniref:ALQxL family class IV lanthipeptide n=1 Tax=Streptomyces sp. E11-3 TaxID=3110112 RepID=UPI003980B705
MTEPDISTLHPSGPSRQVTRLPVRNSLPSEKETLMELDINALQTLAGNDPVSLDNCWWTCGWSSGNVCGFSNACGWSKA